MSIERNRDSERMTENAMPLRPFLQADYSYNQWRHAQMQQLEQDYIAVCERGTACDSRETERGTRQLQALAS